MAKELENMLNSEPVTQNDLSYRDALMQNGLVFEGEVDTTNFDSIHFTDHITGYKENISVSPHVVVFIDDKNNLSIETHIRPIPKFNRKPTFFIDINELIVWKSEMKGGVK